MITINKIVFLFYSLWIVRGLAKNNDTGVIVKQTLNPNAPSFERTGVQNFETLVFSNDITIDKTLLIKSIVQDEGKLYMLNCPSRWGKSINLDMMKTFFRIYIEEFNHTEEITARVNYRLFVDGEVTNGREIKLLKSPMLIARDKQFVKEHLGRWPVIHLDFGFAFGGANFSAMLDGFRYCISLAFEEHCFMAKNYLREIIENEKKDENAKEKARKQLNLFEDFVNCEKSTTVAEIETSIAFLSKLLHEYFKKKVFLLIDEYMAPLQEFILHDAFAQDERENFLEFYYTFLSKTCKTNIHIHKAIVVSEFPPTDELHKRVFSQAIVCNHFTGKFMEYYGFIQDELEEVYYQMNLPTMLQTQIKAKFHGYKSNKQPHSFYNPWSIMKFISTRDFQHCVMDTVDIEDYIPNFLAVTLFREKFHHLLEDDDILVMPEHLYFPQEEFERQLKVYSNIRDAINFGNRLTEGAFMFLHYLGFLTLSKECNVNPKAPPEFYFKFPNGEIGDFMKLKFQSYY